jgi:hypothetical protein
VGRNSSVGIASRYALQVWESNAGGVEIFRNRPHRHWCPPSLIYRRYQLCFPGVKRPGRGEDRQYPFALRLRKDKAYNSSPVSAFGAQMEEGELYLYFILVMPDWMGIVKTKHNGPFGLWVNNQFQTRKAQLKEYKRSLPRHGNLVGAENRTMNMEIFIKKDIIEHRNEGSN